MTLLVYQALVRYARICVAKVFLAHADVQTQREKLVIAGLLRRTYTHKVEKGLGQFFFFCA